MQLFADQQPPPRVVVVLHLRCEMGVSYHVVLCGGDGGPMGIDRQCTCGEHYTVYRFNMHMRFPCGCWYNYIYDERCLLFGEQHSLFGVRANDTKRKISDRNKYTHNNCRTMHWIYSRGVPYKPRWYLIPSRRTNTGFLLTMTWADLSMLRLR